MVNRGIVSWFLLMMEQLRYYGSADGKWSVKFNFLLRPVVSKSLIAWTTTTTQPWQWCPPWIRLPPPWMPRCQWFRWKKGQGYSGRSSPNALGHSFWNNPNFNLSRLIFNWWSACFNLYHLNSSRHIQPRLFYLRVTHNLYYHTHTIHFQSTKADDQPQSFDFPLLFVSIN